MWRLKLLKLCNIPFHLVKINFNKLRVYNDHSQSASSHCLPRSVRVHAFKCHYPKKPKYPKVLETHPSPSLALITKDYRVLNERMRERQCSVPEHFCFPCMTTETHPRCFCFPQRGTSASRLMLSPVVTASK